MAPVESVTGLELAARLVLDAAGVNPEEDGSFAPPFEDTPRRFLDAISEMLVGHYTEPPMLRTFEYEGPPQLITSIDNQAYCLCPHHLLSVELTCSIGYVAQSGSSRVLGLSKLPRLIEWATSRLITQEDLAADLLQRVEKATASQSIFIHIEGAHSCMRARGIKTRGTVVTYLKSPQASPEWEQTFLQSLRRRL